MFTGEQSIPSMSSEEPSPTPHGLIIYLKACCDDRRRKILLKHICGYQSCLFPFRLTSMSSHRRGI
jgi:hypothetical protein